MFPQNLQDQSTVSSPDVDHALWNVPVLRSFRHGYISCYQKESLDCKRNVADIIEQKQISWLAGCKKVVDRAITRNV
jgi:hypothetical protein